MCSLSIKLQDSHGVFPTKRWGRVNFEIFKLLGKKFLLIISEMTFTFIFQEYSFFTFTSLVLKGNDVNNSPRD